MVLIWDEGLGRIQWWAKSEERVRRRLVSCAINRPAIRCPPVLPTRSGRSESVAGTLLPYAEGRLITCEHLNQCECTISTQVSQARLVYCAYLNQCECTTGSGVNTWYTRERREWCLLSMQVSQARLVESRHGVADAVACGRTG
jgi:hypothetical protein